MKTTLIPHGVTKTINLLNDALKRDPVALQALIEHRVPCNESLANHPTIQIQDNPGAEAVGLLGILNGIFGITEDGIGHIIAEYDEQGKLTKFFRTDPSNGDTNQDLETVFRYMNRVDNSECEAQLNKIQERSLSVGDAVIIDGKTFRCDTMGWTEL